MLHERPTHIQNNLPILTSGTRPHRTFCRVGRSDKRQAVRAFLFASGATNDFNFSVPSKTLSKHVFSHSKRFSLQKRTFQEGSKNHEICIWGEK